MKTREDFIKEMQLGNVLMNRELTFKEYVSEILQFQDNVCKMIASDDYYEGMRLDEAMFILESTARKKGLRGEPAVHNGVITMKKLCKEMAITMSGAKGENIVAKTLEFLQRPNTKVYHNVYLTDDIDETELDGVVLTDEGIIILEVKKVKSDVTLTEDGRMVFSGTECYDKIPLADKMELKRRLLKKRLEKVIAEKGFDIPVFVDSFIVFSAPKDKFIKIEDKCHREKHCFRTSINKKIETYVGCACYNKEQLTALGEIFSEMESNVKRFETELNYDEVRQSLADAMVLIYGDESNTENVLTVEKKHSKSIDEIKIQGKSKPNKSNWGYAIACACAGILISGAAILVGANAHKF